jgi:hypothetical protein
VPAARARTHDVGCFRSSILRTCVDLCALAWRFAPSLAWLLLPLLQRLLLLTPGSAGAAMFHPQKCEEDPLLVFRDVKFVMDLAHDLVDGVRGLHLCGAPPAALDDRDLEVRRHVDKPTQRTIWPGQKRTPALKPLTEILNTPSTARHNFASLPTL